MAAVRGLVLPKLVEGSRDLYVQLLQFVAAGSAEAFSRTSDALEGCSLVLFE